MVGKCNMCIFWVCFFNTETNGVPGDIVLEEEGVGQCHRYPPVPLAEYQQRWRMGGEPPPEGEYDFPATTGITWCGEFKPKD